MEPAAESADEMQGAEQGCGVANSLSLIAIPFLGTAKPWGIWRCVPQEDLLNAARCWPGCSGQQHQVLQDQLAALQGCANVLMWQCHRAPARALPGKGQELSLLSVIS